MYVGRDFDPIEPNETDVFTFEFTADLAPGVTISSPVWSCAVANTDAGATLDEDPASRLQGAPNVTVAADPIGGGVRSFANQKVAGMLDGNVYLLEAVVATSDGRTLALHAHVRCKAKI